MHAKNAFQEAGDLVGNKYSLEGEKAGFPTLNPHATRSTTITLMRRAVEVGAVSKSDHKMIAEARFVFTPGDYFHVVVSISERMLVFAHLHGFRTKVNTFTGHRIFLSEDFEKLKAAFLAVPGRKVIEQPMSVDLIDARAASRGGH